MSKVLAILMALSGIAAGQTAGVLDQARKTMGDPKAIQYSGSGSTFTLGQNINPAKPWPPGAELKSFTRTIDYETLSSRNESVGAQGPAPAQFLSGDTAWGQNAAGNVTAAPTTVAERQLQIWMTPHGFLKGALAAKAAAKSRRIGGRKVTEAAFTHGPHRIVGTISGDFLVEKVESWLDNPVLGDMHIETAYSDYRDFGGVKFPTKIVQQQGGFPVLELTVTEARVNVPAGITVPEAARQAAPPVKIASEKLADGVWYITGGSHHSVLVEFRDYVAVIEGPLNEARSTAVIAEVKKLVPGKPIRYLVSTHHHFDHSGGLRAYVAEGATVIAQQVNAPFYQNVVVKAPHKLNPDRLSREKKKLKLVPVGSRYALSDGARTLEILHIQGSPHHDGILMAYLPKEKILVEVDVFNPPAANAPPPATPAPATVNLYENIGRLNLDVERIAALHGRLVTMADLRKAAGK